jgi:hypothetical protein
MFAGCWQIMWAHWQLIRVKGVGYLQLIWAENTDVCRSYGLCLQAVTDMHAGGLQTSVITKPITLITRILGLAKSIFCSLLYRFTAARAVGVAGSEH